MAEITGAGSKQITFMNCEWEKIRAKLKYADGTAAEPERPVSPRRGFVQLKARAMTLG